MDQHTDYRDPLTGTSYRDPFTEQLHAAAAATGSPLQFALRPPEAISDRPMSLGGRVVELLSFLGGALPGRGGVGPLQPRQVRGSIPMPGPLGNVIKARERVVGEPLQQVRQRSVFGSAPGQSDHVLGVPQRLYEARRAAETSADFRPGRVRGVAAPGARHVDAARVIGLGPPGERLPAAERLLRQLLDAFQMSSSQ